MSYQLLKTSLFLKRNWRVGSAIAVALLIAVALSIGVGTGGVFNPSPAEATPEKVADPDDNKTTTGETEDREEETTPVYDPARNNSRTSTPDHELKKPESKKPKKDPKSDNTPKKDKPKKDKPNKNTEDPKQEEPKNEDKPTVPGDDKDSSDKDKPKKKKDTPVKDIKDSVKDQVLDPVTKPLGPVKDVVDEIDNKVLEPVVELVDPVVACVTTLSPLLQNVVKGLGTLNIGAVLKALDLSTLLNPNATRDFKKCLVEQGATLPKK